ncbi:ABC transporter ATP-binding protein [Paractinoplanes maris]|uniref:ABC transporter ATP-binding protein n=1 Tax=Paractinoplanes maris TaxID=1734446 RepID=UPI0020208154|nr:ABC transporter ATP-binding protein [Actinoplanes maris]
MSRSYSSHAETVWAVRDVSLTARPGEFVCISGASGSGKSTLLNLLAGLDSADHGEITVAGARVDTLSETERAQLRLETVGVVFQDHNLIEEFTAAENVALPLEVLGVDSRQARQRAGEELSRVGLAGLDRRFPRQLSGGQRQRVGVARAVIGDRRILLADEPTGALDSKNSRELFALIRSLCDQGVLAVVCSHDIMCREFADTAYEMVDGGLVACGSAERTMP